MNAPVVNTKDSVELVRPLTAADLALLEAPRGVVSSPIKKLRESHHLLARCIAMGWSLREIADKTGYSYSRISILKNDPTFAELIAYYRAKVDEMRDIAQRDHFTQLAALHTDVVEEIHDRVQDQPELISTDTLIDLAKFTADRVGLGPTHKNVNVNFDLAGRVAAGRQRALTLSAAGAAKPGPALPLPGPVPAASEEQDD